MRVVEQENDLHGQLWTARRTVQVSTITQYQKAGRHIYVHTFDRHHSLIRPHNIQTHIAMRRLWSLNFAPTIFTHIAMRHNGKQEAFAVGVPRVMC
jgi:hypothetical protein